MRIVIERQDDNKYFSIEHTGIYCEEPYTGVYGNIQLLRRHINQLLDLVQNIDLQLTLIERFRAGANDESLQPSVRNFMRTELAKWENNFLAAPDVKLSIAQSASS